MEEWKEYKLGDILNFRRGHDLPKSEMKIGDIPVAGSNGIIGYHDTATPVSPCITIGRSGNVGTPYIYDKCWAHNTVLYVDDFKGNNPLYLYYLLKTLPLSSFGGGSAVPTLNRNHIHPLLVHHTSNLKLQERIATCLKSLDDKIEVNRQINDNLEQQAQALFDNLFPNIASGDKMVGDIMIPKRGKCLLSKDAVEGVVPVVAGGIEPATYHNKANTKAPVLTIAASGANAGYVNLWHVPVWSSDSSYIDATMTENVYFWYVLLKKRQKEIFDAQVGSAQPHIYPKHIAEMPIRKIETSDIAKFVALVNPMFEMRGRNIEENRRLAAVRDSLLPKLFSGELHVTDKNLVQKLLDNNIR